MTASSTLSLAQSSATFARQAQALVVDGRSLNALKLQATQGDAQSAQKAAKEAAKQLESLFMRELIKSMRDATMKSGLLDSGGEGDMATDMLDQQLSVQMSGLPGGLSEAIERQLARQMGGDGAQTPVIPGSTLSLDPARRRRASIAVQSSGGDAGGNDGDGITVSKTLEGFVQQHGQAAERVARESGIPASFMLGQAGLETGWGKGQMRAQDGSNAHNLFGIKAGNGWTGKVAEVTTTEYENGAPYKVVARFRAYDSYEDSFRDYARLINENPRYQQARAKTDSSQAYAAELQKAGYATDPQYAAKLHRVIQSAQAAQRAAAAAAQTINAQA